VRLRICTLVEHDAEQVKETALIPHSFRERLAVRQFWDVYKVKSILVESVELPKILRLKVYRSRYYRPRI